MSARRFFLARRAGRLTFPGLPLGSDELHRPAPAGPPSARATWWAKDGTHDDFIELAQQATMLGYRVTVLGHPTRMEDGLSGPIRVEKPEVIGLTLARNAGRERATLLRDTVLGDITTEEAIHFGVCSAGQLGALLARAELGSEGIPRPVQLASVLCSWAGPMMVYRGSTGGKVGRKWDQRKAYLGAWATPMPQRGAAWTFRDTPRWDPHPILRGIRTGFMVAKIRQGGPYPVWPAAVAGDTLRICMSGDVTVAIPIYCAALLEGAGLLEVREVIRDVIAPADPELGHRVAAHYIGLGKSVYQRTHAALTPCPRWSATMSRSGELKWALNQPDMRAARPDVASLLRSSVAARTAAVLASLPYGAACAAHIDGIYEATGEPDLPSALAGQLPEELYQAGTGEPGSWVTGEPVEHGRFYAPGRWAFGPERPNMGGSVMTGPDPVFLRARGWSADPRVTQDAVSWAHEAGTRRTYYDYAWPTGQVRGSHAAE